MKAPIEYQKWNSKIRRILFVVAMVGVITGGLSYGLLPGDTKADPSASSVSPVPRSNGPSLNVDQLVEEGLQNNPEILAAKKRWEVFKEKIPQAFALEDPMFSFGIINLPTNFSFNDEDMTMKEFALSQKLPFPGKRPLMREMAEDRKSVV